MTMTKVEIISLMKAGQLELLRKLFGVVYIPKAV